MGVISSTASESVISNLSVTNPTIVNVPLALANTEYSYTLPISSKRFLIRLREIGTLKLAYAVGTSGTTFLTIPGGVAYSEDAIADSANVTLYFQSSIAGSTAEIVSWL